MAEDDQDRASEIDAEREAEIDAELERVGQNPEQVQEGSETLGSQNAPSGSPRAEGPDRPDDAATGQEDAQELPNDQQEAQWEESGGDEALAEAAVEAADDGDDEEDADDEADPEAGASDVDGADE